MVVVAQFAAKFQIEFAAKLVDALADVFRLKLNVFLVVETNLNVPCLSEPSSMIQINKKSV